WDMGWCDPCAADPLANKELVELGARWIGSDDAGAFNRGIGAATPVYVTRLHVRYDAQSFPEDLVFLETADRSNFQGRYVLRHPFTGKMACDRGEQYQATLPVRFRPEARNLANLPGWMQRGIHAGREA